MRDIHFTINLQSVFAILNYSSVYFRLIDYEKVKIDMLQKSKHTLVDPQTGHLAFSLFSCQGNNPFDHIQRLNFYTLIWINDGTGKLKADISEYKYEKNSLMSFSPFQPFMLLPQNEIKATIIQFHPDFFCIHKHHNEVACDGVLFNNIYDAPFVKVDKPTEGKLKIVVDQIGDELQKPELAQYDSIIAYLKIFLISASRLKASGIEDFDKSIDKTEEPYVLRNLKDCIEEHFRTKHSASEYADMLAINTKSLAKIVKTHFNRTISDVISDRIIIEAKRELYLTNKTVKEIAFNLGYSDEYYFSRFFKKNADVSPRQYRKSVGFDRASSSS